MTYPLHLLNDEEKQVYIAIFQNKRIKMAEVAKQVAVGHHKKYEEPQQRSTCRKVRKIIRDLRIKNRIPIMADNKGYFVAHEKHEAKEFMAKTSARLVSSLIMYHTLKKMFDVECKEVEDQLKLFDLDQEKAKQILK